MDIRVPALAEGIDSGTIVSILVKVGDRVKKDDPLVEIETNKAVADIPSTGEGTVSKIHVQEGDDVPVGSILISLNGEGTEVSRPKASTQEAKPSPGLPPEQKVTPASASYVYPSKSGFPPPASPSIRKMAHELGVDLARIRGSGPGDRITREDIQIYMKQMQNMDSASKLAVNKFATSIDFSKWGTVEKIKITKLRKTIAGAMTNSWTTIPHVTQFDDLSIDSILALVSKHKDKYKSKGVRLTLTSFIIRAVGYVLKEFPNFNTSIDEEAGEIVYKKYFHIGIAVDTEHGLMVPVLRDVDKKSLLDISRELGEL
ncbi:2-oxo acid dehydrogenase subunit E2, partial [PVC group bacterium]|nr:2-oxo acid dehydrogenase subunit E2 [PVC group bacterium]